MSTLGYPKLSYHSAYDYCLCKYWLQTINLLCREHMPYLKFLGTWVCIAYLLRYGFSFFVVLYGLHYGLDLHDTHPPFA